MEIKEIRTFLDAAELASDYFLGSNLNKYGMEIKSDSELKKHISEAGFHDVVNNLSSYYLRVAKNFEEIESEEIYLLFYLSEYIEILIRLGFDCERSIYKNYRDVVEHVWGNYAEKLSLFKMDLENRPLAVGEMYAKRS